MSIVLYLTSLIFLLLVNLILKLCSEFLISVFVLLSSKISVYFFIFYISLLIFLFSSYIIIFVSFIFLYMFSFRSFSLFNVVVLKSFFSNSVVWLPWGWFFQFILFFWMSHILPHFSSMTCDFFVVENQTFGCYNMIIQEISSLSLPQDLLFYFVFLIVEGYSRLFWDIYRLLLETQFLVLCSFKSLFFNSYLANILGRVPWIPGANK